MTDALLLPDSRLRDPKGTVMRDGVEWQPIFCANCGCPGGYVPVENVTFVLYLCDEKQQNCHARLGNIAGTFAVPDEVFFEVVRQEQIEKYGRELTAPELAEVLADNTSTLAALARDQRRSTT